MKEGYIEDFVQQLAHQENSNLYMVWLLTIDDNEKNNKNQTQESTFLKSHLLE